MSIDRACLSMFVLFRVRNTVFINILRCAQYGHRRHSAIGFSLYMAQRSNQVTWCSLDMQVGHAKLR